MQLGFSLVAWLIVIQLIVYLTCHLFFSPISPLLHRFCPGHTNYIYIILYSMKYDQYKLDNKLGDECC